MSDRAMQFVNELWQADTLYGPGIKQAGGQWKKTFLIAFMDDASRVITHAEFFYRDNTENMVTAFRSALYKRGKPERLYFDNGSNYSSKEIAQACVRLNILLSHAPIRDGAAKGKIERFIHKDVMYAGFAGAKTCLSWLSGSVFNAASNVCFIGRAESTHP